MNFNPCYRSGWRTQMFSKVPLIFAAGMLVAATAQGQDDDPPFPLEFGMLAWGTTANGGAAICKTVITTPRLCKLQ